MDELRLVKAVDGLGERIVVAVADAADGWLYPGFCQAFSVFYGNVLASSVNPYFASGARSCSEPPPEVAPENWTGG
jgi:hypothetical protein